VPPDVPAAVLQHVAAASGGQVVVVTGAGCSMEPPTSLLSGGSYSENAYAALVHDGILTEHAVPEPWDLSKLADIVQDVTGDLKALTDRLPGNAWRMSTPNVGHRYAAALLIEGALRCVVTLNYDLAIQNALGQLGSPPNVTVIKGPEEHDAMGATSLVYLHRSAESPPASWVLRKSDLDNAWQDGWEEILAKGALSAPVTVFAGLGSPAAVLTESVATLAALGGTSYYLADPDPTGPFFDALSDHLAEVIKLGWCDLMRTLGDRVVQYQLATLTDATRALAQSRSLGAAVVAAALASVAGLRLLPLGATRAAWLLHGKPYLRREESQDERLADSLLSIGEVSVALGAAPSVLADGVVRLTSTRAPDLSVLWVHAGGIHTLSDVTARMETAHADDDFNTLPRVVVVDGPRAAAAVPGDLLRSEDSADLIRGGSITIALDMNVVRSQYLGDTDELRRRLSA
jgi:hypothetical protein